MAKLTEQDVTALKWSITCNADGIGYLGPTVKKYGPLPEMRSLVERGLLRVDEDIRPHGHRDPDKCGYFITPAGRQALSADRSE